MTGAEPVDALPDGYSETAGFMLTPETREALGELDLGDGPASYPAARRALLLDRDGIAVDGQLVEHLRSSGLDVVLAPGEGWSAMMQEPGLGRPPLATFRQVDQWLSEAGPGPVDAAAELEAPIAATDVLELEIDGRAIRETPLTVFHPYGDLFCILSEPVDEPTADVTGVLLNAGAVRRVGPNRMWVEMSRRWAARGVPTLRVDLGGIGDSGGDATCYYEVPGFYVPELASHVSAILDMLEERGSGRFALGGMCAGAYWAFQFALRDQRVAAAYMVNPSYLFWDSLLVAVREARLVRRLKRAVTWRRIFTGKVPLSRMIELVRYFFRRWILDAPGVVEKDRGGRSRPAGRRRPTRG